MDAFEGKAVAAAKETLAKISKEEGSLKETLSNIQEARPFEDLTVSRVSQEGQGYGMYTIKARGGTMAGGLGEEGMLRGAWYSLQAYHPSMSHSQTHHL